MSSPGTKHHLLYGLLKNNPLFSSQTLEHRGIQDPNANFLLALKKKMWTKHQSSIDNWARLILKPKRYHNMLPKNTNTWEQIWETKQHDHKVWLH